MKRIWSYSLKKVYIKTACIVFAFLTFAACSSEQTAKQQEGETENQPFAISKGVNISNWLSQSDIRGTDRVKNFTQKEVDNLSKWGFDHIRLPVDEEQLFNQQQELDTETVKLIHNTIKWCQAANMRVILDFHILRSHHFNDTNIPLWTDDSEQDKFVEMWKKIAREFHNYPNSLLAFELLNEPVAPNNFQWNALSAGLIAELRKTEPERFLVLGSNKWSSTDTFSQLKVPANDSNIILTFHFYEPYALTHYRTSWSDFKDFQAKLIYPGKLISDKDYSALSESDKNKISPYNKIYNKSVLAEQIKIAINKANESGLKLLCGEFGCYTYTDETSKINWIKDVVSICKENGIAYSHWEYKAGFGFCNWDGTIKDQELLNTLIK